MRQGPSSLNAPSGSQGRHELRDTIAYAKEYAVLDKVCDQIQHLQEVDDHVVEDEQLSWYMRHRLLTDDGVSFSSARILKDRIVPYMWTWMMKKNLFGEEDK